MNFKGGIGLDGLLPSSEQLIKCIMCTFARITIVNCHILFTKLHFVVALVDRLGIVLLKALYCHVEEI